MILTAKYPGTCPLCSGRIRPGKDKIAHYAERRLTVHAECVRQAEREELHGPR